MEWTHQRTVLMVAGLLATASTVAKAQLTISEVADKGTDTSVCNGEDWVEIYNAGTASVTAPGLQLCDDRNCEHPAALSNPLAPGDYLLLCRRVDFEFGIKDDETIELRDTDSNGSTIVVDSTTLGGNGVVGKTWARQQDGSFGYTTAPTPGGAYAGAGDTVPPAVMQLLVTEVSDKGTTGVCSGEDWIELYNPSPDPLDLVHVQVCDGVTCSSMAAAELGGESYVVLCRGVDFEFGIASGDVVTVRTMDGASVAISTTTVPVGGEDGRVWTRESESPTASFSWSYTPTPGRAYAGVGTRAAADGTGACARLNAEQGLNCTACVSNLPPELPCTRTAAQDEAAEVSALFGQGQAPRALWAATQFLWSEATPPRTFELRLSQENLEFLMENPSREEYVTGSLWIDGLGEWHGVGIRMKGYYGSLRICFIDMIECKKLSYKLKFNHVNASQTFFGLKKLQFHSSIHDPTLMRERLAYSIWREMGVAAPRSTHVGLTMRAGDGEPANIGVHLLTEVLDGRFTDAYFDGGDGTLYKEAWPGMADPTQYALSMETNEGRENTTQLEAFGEALQSAQTDFQLVQAVKRFTRPSKWARYLAVDRAVGHWDGPLNFRDATNGVMTRNSNGEKCHASACRENGEPDGDCCALTNARSCVDGFNMTAGPECYRGFGFTAYHYCCSNGNTSEMPFVGSAWTHNYFLYESEHTDHTEREFELIAWDVDNVLQVEQSAKQPVWDLPVCMGSDSQSEARRAAGQCTDCQPFETDSGAQFPASCFKLVRAFARGLRSEYMVAAQQLLEGPLQQCRINTKLQRWQAEIADLMAVDVAEGLFPATSYSALEGFEHCMYSCCTGPGFTGCDDSKCTSPDGSGGTDCCASLSWSEPKTCAAGYEVREWNSWTWTDGLTTLRDEIVPSFVTKFRESVSCAREYRADFWDPIVPSADVEGILQIEDWGIDGDWSPPWIGAITPDPVPPPPPPPPPPPLTEATKAGSGATIPLPASILVAVGVPVASTLSW